MTQEFPTNNPKNKYKLLITLLKDLLDKKKETLMRFILSDKINQIIEQETVEKGYHKLIDFINLQAIPDLENIIIPNKVYTKDNLDKASILRSREDLKMQKKEMKV